MTKSTELLNEVILNAKALRRFGGQSGKAKKHRYERRKVQFFIRQGDWSEIDSF
jgi:hypothetical protein